MHLFFCLQLAALDLVLRGAPFYLAQPRAVGHLAASVALLHLLASARPRPIPRAAAALFLGAGVSVQAAFFRYYHATLDDQAAAAARLAWADVRPMVLHALPSILGLAAAVAALEFALLARLARAPIAAPRRRLAAIVVVAGVAAGGPLRHGTTELRTAVAAASFALAAPRAHAAPGAPSRPLPPLPSRRARVPSVLVLLTESVRASDWCGDARPCPVAPEIDAVLPDRVPLLEMRSVTSYTAISMSVLLTGLPQLGPREPIVSAPDLFDLVRATREGDRPVGIHYWSAHTPSFFERSDPAAAVDSYLTADIMVGHPLIDVEEAVMGGLDRRLADECRRRLPALARPYVALVHFSGTHAPYFFDESRARFRPFGRVVNWSGMEDLHRSYQNALLEQDRSLAACARAFHEAQGDAPHVVIFTSDHGEAFGEHWAIHHGQNLYDEQTHVPAFVDSFGGALDADEQRALEGARGAFVTHFDVLPTILDALGVLDHFAIRAETARMPGRSLLRPWPADPPAVPITNCSEMWQCPLDTWGLLSGDRKLLEQVWDGQWRCLSLRGGEREIGLDGCADLVGVSRGFFAKRPDGSVNR